MSSSVVDGAMDAGPAPQGGWLATTWRRVEAVVERLPFTVSVLSLMLVAGLVTGGLWRPLVRSAWWDHIAYGLPAFQQGHWWTIVTGSVVATEPLQYVPVALGFALMVGFAEYRLGTRTALLATLLGQVVGLLGADGLLALTRSGGWVWPRELSDDLDAGFSAGALCALTLAAYALHAPWRGRLLFAVLGYAVVNLLFVGVLWDVEHAFAVATGLVLGRFVHPHRASGTGLRMTRREWRLFAAGTVLLIAVSQVVALLYPTNGPLGADEFALGHRIPVLVFAIMQCFLAAGLARGSRMAWRLGLAFAATGFVASGFLSTPRLVVGVLAYGLVAAILVQGRRAFSAPLAPLAAAWVVRTAVLTLLGLLAYGFLGYEAFDFTPEPTVGQALEEWVNRLVFSTTGAFRGSSRAADAFLVSLSLTWLVALLSFLVAVLLRVRRPTASLDRDVAMGLLHEYGGGNLSWMSVWPDNAHFVTADRRASIAYQVHNGTAIALGDPIGSPDACASAVREFARYCERVGLHACLFSTSSAVLPQVAELGWRHAQVAEDTVIDLPGLAFKGKAWQDIRTALNRAGKAGVGFRLGPLADQPFSVVEQVRGISEQWVGDKGLPEMGFTLGGVEEALDPEVRVGLAVDEGGTVHGVTSWLPVYGPGGVATGWTLDVMRRRPDGFRAVVEFLVAQSCLAFQEQGALTVSLSGAPLARAADDTELGPVDDMLDRLGGLLEPYYGFRSLHQFKMKFQPRYEPMYLCYPDEAALPRIGLALTRAYLPDLGLRDLPALVRSGREG